MVKRQKAAGAWIPLTVFDDEPAVFCRYLATALADLDPTAEATVRAALDDPGFSDAPFEFFFRAVSFLSTKSEGVIVLDDFHLIENPAILSALPLVIKKLSQLHRLAFLSRLVPPVALADLLIKDQMGEVNENDLRFTRRQIISLYKNSGIVLSAGEATDIEEQTAGWALGLGAELLSLKTGPSEGFMSRASGEKYIFSYLVNEIWSKWDDTTQTFLLQTSILEDLPADLCDRLSGSDSETILSGLLSNSGLVVRMPDSSYRYHHILRDFLRQKAEKRETELAPLYIMAAQYMSGENRFSAALDYYVKSGDYDALGAFIMRTLSYSLSKVSAEECLLSFKNLILDKVPVEIVEKTEAFTPICTYVYWITGNAEKMKFWFSKARDLLLTAQDDQMKGTMLALLSLDPYSNPWELLSMMPTDENLQMETVPSISITINLPYFHRSMRDYSDYLDVWDSLASQLTQGFESIVGVDTIVTLLGISCGIFYERNSLAEAYQSILAAYSLMGEQSHPELFFAVHMQIADIQFAEGRDREAWESVDTARTIIEKRALYLEKNLQATITKYRLYKGDADAARQWLADYAVHDSMDMAIYQIPQVLATARAHIAVGSFSSALVLLARLESLAMSCRRTLDLLETLVLRSIALWNQRQREQAIDTLHRAVLLAQPCGYVRIFANDGTAIAPVLQKLYNRLSTGVEESELAVFVRTVQLLANENAATYPSLTSSIEEKPVRLSKQQMLMLQYLAAGLNNRQICEATGLKLNTVKAHLYKLYEKLEVNTAIDAVLKARQLGLVE